MELDLDNRGELGHCLASGESGMDLGTYQTSKQILIDLSAPPVIASIFWLLARGWVASNGSGDVSSLTKQKLKLEFRIILVLLYLMVIGETVCRLLT